MVWKIFFSSFYYMNDALCVIYDAQYVTVRHNVGSPLIRGCLKSTLYCMTYSDTILVYMCDIWYSCLWRQFLCRQKISPVSYDLNVFLAHVVFYSIIYMDWIFSLYDIPCKCTKRINRIKWMLENCKIYFLFQPIFKKFSAVKWSPNAIKLLHFLRTIIRLGEIQRVIHTLKMLYSFFLSNLFIHVL